VLRRVLFVARKDLRFMLLARETLLWTFLMPIVFFFFIGNVTSGFSRPRGERADPLRLEVGEGAGFLADELGRRLGEQGYAVTIGVPADPEAAPTRRVAVPAAFTDSVLAGTPATVLFEHEGEGIGADYERFRVSRAVYAVLADLVVARGGGAAPTQEAFAALAAMPRTVRVESEPAGKRPRIPTGFEQAVPGILVMFSLLVMVTSGSVLLLIERKEGLLRRLASAPLRRGEVVAGKWLGKLSLGLVQMTFGMVAGTLLFGVDWGPDLPAVAGTLLAWCAFTSALGLLLGSVARTHGQAVAMGVIGSNLLAPLGGCWWPIEIAPRWMQKLATFLPTGWAMDALHRLVSFQAGPASAAWHVAALAAGTALLLVAGTRAFRWD
jgi:ABC-type Na+ efflux pump permease subunit